MFRKMGRKGLSIVDAMPLMAMLSIKNQKTLALGRFEKCLSNKRPSDSEIIAYLFLNKMGL